MKKRIIGMALVLVTALSTYAPFAWALPQRTTLEYEKEVYEFIHDNVLPEHAMGLDYRNISKADAKELQDIVDSVTAGCSTVRDKAYAIYLCISQNVAYNYDDCTDADVLHCEEKDCPIPDISNTSGVSVAMAHHVYKSGLGICEDYANLSSVMMKMAGIPTILISDMDGSHAFNAFYDGSRWVFFDTTWANQKNPQKHFDISVEDMYSFGSHRLHSLQALDKGGILYDVWFSEERYCDIVGSLSGQKKLTVYPGLYDIRFIEDYPVSPIHPDVQTVVVEEGVTEIPENFFKGCYNLSKVTLPDTLKKIGSYSFEKCTSLTSFDVPDSVTTLGTGIIEYSGVKELTIGSGVSDCPGTAFLNSENLKKVVISEGVEEICYGMFMYCDKIEEIHFPSTLKKIGSSAFYGMDEIKKVYYNGTEEDWAKIKKDILNEGLPASKKIIFLKGSQTPETDYPVQGEDDEEKNSQTKPKEETPKPPKDTELTEKDYNLREVKMPKENSSSQKQKPNGKLSNIKKKKTYKNQFSDVKNEKWYAEYIQTAFETGIINGKPDGTFAPDAPVSVAEVVKMASLINYYYRGLNDEERQFSATVNEKWYEPYAEYASQNLLDGKTLVGDFGEPATRLFTAFMFDSCLPSEEYEPLVDVTSIPDLFQSDSYYKSVLRLYKAGVLSGSDDKGTFNPDSNLTRSEAVAIITRIIDATKRKGYKEPESANAVSKENIYTESKWIKITKIEYLDDDAKYAHTITETQCYNIGDKDVFAGMDFMAITGKISLKENIPANATVLQGSYVKMPNGLKYAGHDSNIDLSKGTFEFSLVKLIPAGKYVYTNVLSVNGELCRVNIHFTVK